MSNTVALVPVYASASANTSEQSSEQISELPEITLDKQVDDQYQNMQNEDTAHLSTKQKVVQFINQLIPYYAQNGKQQGPEWLRTTEFNLTFTEDLKPIYSLETIQPFTKEVTDGKLGFWQGRYAYQSGSNSTANLGVGLRWLSEDKTSITGINAFYDYAFKHDLSRVGVGAEYFNKQAEYRANVYIPTSGDRQTGRTDLADGVLYSYIRAVSGFDYEVGTTLANAPWLSLYASGFHYDNKHKDDENGYRLRSKMQLTPRLSMEMGYTNSNLSSGSLYGKVLYQLADTAGPALRGGSAQEQSNDISHKLLQKVQRENEIKTETFTKLVAYTGSLSVKVTNSSGVPLQGAQVQAYQNSSPVGAAAATDATGTAVISGLDVGEYTVRATYFGISDDSSTVTVQKNQTTTVPPIALAVVGGRALIHVLDDAGADVGGATVTAEAVSGLHGAADKSLFDRILGVKTAYAAAGFKVTAVTEANGIATFDNLPPGKYKFTVTYSGKEMKSLAVAVADGSTGNGTVVLPASGGNIVAMITDAVSKAAIKGAAVELKNGSNVIATKTTGDDGTVVFSGLTAGPNYTVTASAANYDDQSISTTVSDKETVAAALALTPQTGSAKITVKDNDANAPVKSVEVSVTVNGKEEKAYTDTNGEATFTNIPPGTYTFTATKGGFVSAAEDVVIGNGAEATAAITLTRKIVDVSITVIDQDDKPIAGAKVTMTVAGEKVEKLADSSGKVTFEKLSGGYYYNFTPTKLGYGHSSYSFVLEDTTTKIVQLFIPTKEITITVIDEAGKPIEGVSVSTDVFNGEITAPVNETTNASGIAVFTKLVANDYTFTATKAGYVSATTVVSTWYPDKGAIITLKPKLITAQVHVKDGDGNNISRVEVRVKGNGVDETKATDFSGNVTFSNLPAGEYTFTAIDSQFYTDASETISISENTSFELTILRKFGEVTLIVQDKDTGLPISGAAVHEGNSTAGEIIGYTDSEGKFELGNLPTGNNQYCTVTKEYYKGLINGLDVKEGKNTPVVNLERGKSKVKVTVKNKGGKTVEGASVTVNGITKTTGSSGTVTIESIPAGEAVVFTVSMPGFYADTTVTAEIPAGQWDNDTTNPVEIILLPLDS